MTRTLISLGVGFGLGVSVSAYMLGIAGPGHALTLVSGVFGLIFLIATRPRRVRP
ncbi:MAG: hypothetical protein HOY78_02110 [Saccharothrix sp.]|nr:hypothetical protein [Saccharothrix sp.]